jgi:alcohol dehydrogenase class IV
LRRPAGGRKGRPYDRISIDMPDLDALRANWSYPTAIRFGVGRIAELAEACRTVGMSRPLLVTDPGLAGLPMVTDAADALRRAGLGVAVFSRLRGNPVARNVEDGVAAFRAGGHDGVVAFGGGSALDTGKVIAFMVGQDRPMWDFEDIGDWWTRAKPDGIAPVIAVPTTAGTGSEVGRAGVITDEATHTKKIIFHPRMMPAIVIADPALTVGLPPHVTAATGMDALAHNLEAYCAPGFHPLADGIAAEGVRLVKEWLPRAVADGTDLAARAHMMAAASMGATAFQKGLGAIHALSHPIGALYDAHHGLTNAVFMPYVLAFNRPVIGDKLERLAAYIGVAEMIEWVLTLRREIGIPHTLAGLKVGPERFDELAEMAANDPTAGSNPVKVGSSELKRLYEDALVGRL